MKTNLRKRIGYIPQITEYNADLPFTLREIVAMGRVGAQPLLRRLGPEDHAAVDLWIERVGLAGRSGQTFRSLSGGEQQKALIARAMVQDPLVLMLDEPFASLDFAWKQQITNIINDLHLRSGLTVLMVCHEINLLPPRCGRTILMRAGDVCADGPTGQVLAGGALEKAYNGKMKVLSLRGRYYPLEGET